MNTTPQNTQLKIKTFFFNPYRVCTYLLSLNNTHIIIDPGMFSPPETQRFHQYIETNKITPNLILITHTHPDHICGINNLLSSYPSIPVLGYKYASPQNPFPTTNDGFIQHDNLPFPIFVILTPGHKTDSVCYFFPTQNILFTGDTLFQNSIGRTDLPEGNSKQLASSLSKLTSPNTYTPCEQHLNCKIDFPNIQIFPGHGPNTTMKQELENNPYLQSLG